MPLRQFPGFPQEKFNFTLPLSTHWSSWGNWNLGGEPALQWVWSGLLLAISREASRGQGRASPSEREQSATPLVPGVPLRMGW